jgi:hypothetical protein
MTFRLLSHPVEALAEGTVDGGLIVDVQTTHVEGAFGVGTAITQVVRYGPATEASAAGDYVVDELSASLRFLADD